MCESAPQLQDSGRAAFPPSAAAGGSLDFTPQDLILSGSTNPSKRLSALEVKFLCLT